MNRGFLIGVTVATGAMLLIPGVAFAASRAGQPLMRAAVRTGAVAYKEFRKAGAEFYEHMEDLAAEFEAEVRRDEEGETGDADVTAPAGDVPGEDDA